MLNGEGASGGEAEKCSNWSTGTGRVEQLRASAAESRVRTWIRLHTAWFGRELPPWPLTPSKIKAVVAMLKVAKSANPMAYVSVARSASLDLGFVEHPLTNHIVRRVKASSERGIGLGKQTHALPGGRLGQLPDGREPWVAGGPINPRVALLVGSWWLLRETEVAAAELVDVSLDFGRSTATLKLPCSKTDQRAIGVIRVHGCACSSQEPECPRYPCCPFHALADHMRLLEGKFGSDVDDPGFPLFPSSDGRSLEYLRTVFEAPVGFWLPSAEKSTERGARGQC